MAIAPSTPLPICRRSRRERKPRPPGRMSSGMATRTPIRARKNTTCTLSIRPPSVLTVVNISVAEHAAQTMKKAPRVAGDSRPHAARQSLMPAPRRTIRHRARAGGSRRPDRAASSTPRSRRAGVPGCLPAWGIGLPWNAAGTAGSVAATGSNLAFEGASAPGIIGHAAGGPDREPEEGEVQLVRSGYRVAAMATIGMPDGRSRFRRRAWQKRCRGYQPTPRSATPPSSSGWAPPPLGGLGRRNSLVATPFPL